jgi:hypothetical protein
MNVNDLETKMREILGEDAPIASFAFRRPGNPQESKTWEAEGVVVINPVDPSSLDIVIEEAKRRRFADGETPQGGSPSGQR